METGTKISLTAHGVMIGLALFGGPIFNSDSSEAIQVADVSVISTAEFEALASTDPAAFTEQPVQNQPEDQSENLETPPQDETVPDTPDQSQVEAPSDADESPDLTALKVPEQPELDVESPNLAEQANDSVGSTLVVPDSPIAEEESSGQRQPEKLAVLEPKSRPAPRVDTTAAEKPETDAAEADETQSSTAPSDAATEEVEAAEETAPKESATEIVTEPEVDPDSAAPVKSSRPKGRPTDIAALVEKAQQEEDEAAEQARKDADAAAIEAALAAAQNETQPSVPSGPPLTSSEKNGLVLAVQKCWNVPVGLQNASDLVVVLSVELKPDGKLAGAPVLIEPAGTPTGTTQQAFEAGRRALIRCAPYSSLPAEKYEQWRQLEVVFNPKKMVVK